MTISIGTGHRLKEIKLKKQFGNFYILAHDTMRRNATQSKNANSDSVTVALNNNHKIIFANFLFTAVSTSFNHPTTDTLYIANTNTTTTTNKLDCK